MDAVTVSLYKNKGEKLAFKLTRHLLLSIVGKILARVLLSRLIPTIAQENTPESQCGFRSNRGTVDMIFMLRQDTREMQITEHVLYAAFVDLTKAFDTVSRDGLENPGAPWLSPQMSQHPPPAPSRSGKTQWTSVGQLPHLQRRQAGMRSGHHIVLHLLQHHVP